MKSWIKNKIHIIFLFIYSFLMTYLHSFNSIRFDDASIYSDNAVFYLMGRAMLQGKVLYKDMFDHKTPYVYFINAIASIFDKNHVGLYIVTSLVLFVSLYFTYKIAMLFLEDKLLSIVASGFICLFLNNANLTLGFLRTEGYAISLLLPSAYLFIKFLLSDEDDFPLYTMFIIGILAGVTLLINVKAVILYVPFAITSLIILIMHKYYTNIFLCYVMGSMGVMIALIPAIIYVIQTDCIEEAINAVFNVNAIYSNYDSAVNAFHENKIETILTVFRLHPILTLTIILELISIILYSTKTVIKLSVFVSFMLCLAYTIYFNRPYTYYYTIIIPYMIPVYLFICDKFLDASIGRYNNGITFTIVSMVLFFIINFPIGYSIINKKYEVNLLAKKMLYEKLAPQIELNDKTKVLSYGFSPEYYMFLNKNISFKYFIIPNIKFEYYSEPYLRQIDYIRDIEPDVLVFSFGDYTTQLPTEYFDEFRRVVDNNYRYLGDLNIYVDTTKNPKVLVKK